MRSSHVESGTNYSHVQSIGTKNGRKNGQRKDEINRNNIPSSGLGGKKALSLDWEMVQMILLVIRKVVMKD